MSNYQCPIAIHCGDYPFANLSSEGLETEWLPPRGQYWTGIGYCCDTTLKVGWSGVSQADADLTVNRILDTACPTCSDAQKFCANADCADGSNLTEICVVTSQADADALAAAAAAAMAPYCDTKEDLYQATCACPDGTDSHTVHSNISEAVAEAQCDAIVKNCIDGGSDDGGGGSTNPGNNPTHGVCNTAQTCTETHEGTVLSYTVPAGTICKMTLAEANAYALSLACAMLKFQPARLSGLVPFCCLLESFSASIAITGATGSFTWDVVGTLPPGLTLTQSGNFIGIISGTPTTPGTYAFSVRVLLAANHYATRTYSLIVFGFTTSSVLADGEVSTAYSQQIVADGGSGNYLFSVTAGTLPDGLALGDTGFITGTPTTEETALFTVTVQDLVTPTMTCSLQFEIDVVGSEFATSTIITAVKSHYVLGLNTVFLFADARCTTGSTYVTGIVFYREGATIIGNGNCGLYGLADTLSLGLLAASKIVHGDLIGTGNYEDSSSDEIEVFGVNYWPNTVQIDAAALAAFQALKPTIAALMTIDGVGTFKYYDASLGLELLSGSTLNVQWTGGFAIYKRHDNSLVPTGVFYFYTGTANPIAQVTIS